MVKFLQTLHLVGFNDNIYLEGYISRLPVFVEFSLFKLFVNIINDLMVSMKIGI